MVSTVTLLWPGLRMFSLCFLYVASLWFRPAVRLIGGSVPIVWVVDLSRLYPASLPPSNRNRTGSSRIMMDDLIKDVKRHRSLFFSTCWELAPFADPDQWFLFFVFVWSHIVQTSYFPVLTRNHVTLAGAFSGKHPLPFMRHKLKFTWLFSPSHLL